MGELTVQIAIYILCTPIELGLIVKTIYFYKQINCFRHSMGAYERIHVELAKLSMDQLIIILY